MKQSMDTESPFTSRADAYIYIMTAYRWGSGVTGFYGMSTTGERGEQPKGFFTEGNQTERGYRSTALRIFQNVKAAGRDPWTGELSSENE